MNGETRVEAFPRVHTVGDLHRERHRYSSSASAAGKPGV